MSITDPQFGEETNQIAGAIDVFGSSSNFFDNINDIISGRNLVNDILGADVATINLDGSLDFEGGGMSLADQIQTEVTTMQADNALAQIKEELETQVAEIQANTVLSDQEKKVRIAQLADNWLDNTGAPNSVKAEVMTSVWSELGHEVTLTPEGYGRLPQAYGVRADEGGFIDLSDPVVTPEDAGGGGASSSTTVDAGGSPAAGGGGSVVSGSQAESAQQAAAAAAEATANDPNAAAAQAAVDAAMAGANQDAGDNRDIVTDADGTVWVNTGSYPTAPNVNGWVTNNPSAEVIADYEAQTGNTYVGGPLTIGLPKGQFPASGTANAGDGSGEQNNQNNQDGNGLLENAAAILGGLSATVLNNADPYDVTVDNSNTNTTTDTTNNTTTNTTTTTFDDDAFTFTCPTGTVREGDQVVDLAQCNVPTGGDTATVCGTGTELEGQPIPADGNCNPNAGTGEDVCPAGTELQGQAIPTDGNCNPNAGTGGSVCPAGTKLQGQDIPADGNCNPADAGEGVCAPGTKLQGQTIPADGNCNPSDDGGDSVCGAGTQLAGQLTPADGECNPNCGTGTELEGQLKPADGNCNPGDGDDVCGAGTKLAGQLVPADGNCNPGPGGTGFCRTGTELAGQAIPTDGNCNPSSGEGPGTDPGTGGTGGGPGGDGTVYNLFAQTARTPATLTVLENRGLDYELTPLLSRVLNI